MLLGVFNQKLSKIIDPDQNRSKMGQKITKNRDFGGQKWQKWQKSRFLSKNSGGYPIELLKIAIFCHFCHFLKNRKIGIRDHFFADHIFSFLRSSA